MRIVINKTTRHDKQKSNSKHLHQKNFFEEKLNNKVKK